MEGSRVSVEAASLHVRRPTCPRVPGSAATRRSQPQDSNSLDVVELDVHRISHLTLLPEVRMITTTASQLSRSGDDPDLTNLVEVHQTCGRREG